MGAAPSQPASPEPATTEPAASPTTLPADTVPPPAAPPTTPPAAPPPAAAPASSVTSEPASTVPPPDPVNGALPADEQIEETQTPIYVAGYRIPGDNVKWFLAANVAFVIVLVIITVLVMPLGIPFLAVKRADGFLGYIGFFFTYMFGYFVFFMLMVFTLGAGSYAVQQRYFA